jgi:signal transduction histidine kinase
MTGPTDSEAIAESHWDALVVGDSPSLRDAFEPCPTAAQTAVITNFRCRGRSLRLTWVADEPEAIASLGEQRFHAALVGATATPLGPVCESLRARGAPLRIVLCPEANGLQGDPAFDALDLDACPCAEPQALHAIVRAALRHADDLGSLDATRNELVRQMTLRERLEGIAAMVTGITHDVSTPLGVASTAGSVVDETARRLLAADLGDERVRAELVDDMRDALDILTRSLERARRLIDSFKQFSASQFSNERAKVQLVDVITDCVMVLRSELRRARIALEVHAPPDEDLRWDGFPGHLGRVLVNLL